MAGLYRRFLQPRIPKRKADFPEDGTIYFRPMPARWDWLTFQPKVASSLGILELGSCVLSFV